MTTVATDMVEKEVQRLTTVFERLKSLIKHLDKPIKMRSGEKRRAILVGELPKNTDRTEQHILVFTREGPEMWMKWEENSDAYYASSLVSNPFKKFVEQGGRSWRVEVKLVDILQIRFRKLENAAVSVAQISTLLRVELLQQSRETTKTEIEFELERIARGDGN